MSPLVLRAPTPGNPSSTEFRNDATYRPRPVTGVDPITGAVTTSDPFSPNAGTPEQNDALAYMTAFLRDYGLESLSGWAWEQILAGNSPTVIVQELHNRPEFKTRFPAYFSRRDKNLAPMSVAQIIDYENRARQLFRQYGIPPGFYDTTEELQQFISDDVSLAELNDRVQLASQVYFDTDPTMRGELTRLYGTSFTPGQEIAYILDPAKALPLLQRQVSAAALSSTAVRSTYGGLTTGEAEGLVSLGTTPQQAGQGFADLRAQRELFTTLPGEGTGAGLDSIARAEQLAAQFANNATAQERIRRAAERRVAAFRGRAQYVESREGVLGLGTSNT